MTPDAGLTIRQVSEMLGVPTPTLRSWERRYGIPTPTRTAGGHRRYLPAELHHVRLMRDETTRGKPAADAARAVRLLLDQDDPSRPLVARLLEASRRADPDMIRGVLDEARGELGLGAAVDSIVLPSMRQIGAWWESGRCGLAQEHMTTETIRAWFSRITTLADAITYEPPVLLACGPRDQHTIGLEALGALLAEGHRGTRLMGPRTSERTLVAAASATSAAAVVVVSHLRTQRRPAVDALRAVAGTGTTVFYAGNAFSFPAQRVGVPGTYLGESLSVAATMIGDALPAGSPGPRRPRRAA